MPETILGLDLGTTGIRAILYEQGGGQIASAYEEYPLITLPGGGAEQDANCWWEISCKMIRAVVEKSGRSAQSVKSLGISTQGISFVPVDENNRPLYNAISWLDMRAESEMAEILNYIDKDRLYALTGKRASASYTLPKMLWFKRHYAEIFEKASKFLLPNAFLLAKLTGSVVTDHTAAAGTMHYSLENESWSHELMEQVGIRRNTLPEIRWGGEQAGGLCKTAAEATGLCEGMPVYTGAQDQKCADLAAGLEKGVAVISLGTAAAITALEDSTCAGTDRLARYPFFNPGERILEGVVPTAGLALRWLKSNLSCGNSYKELDILAREARKNGSPTYFLPHLSGSGSPDWNAEQRGSLHDITLDTGPGALALAVMEGVTVEIARNVLELSKGCGEISEIRMFGGGATSDLWPQIIADCTGRRVTIFRDCEMACLGAAMLAGLKPAEIQKTEILPDTAYQSRYQNRLMQYKSAD